MTEIKVPAKIQTVLDMAGAMGMTIEHDPADRDTPIHSWTITSPEDRNMIAVFLHWTPGASGGRVQCRLHRPFARPRSRMTKVSRKRACDLLHMITGSSSR